MNYVLVFRVEARNELDEAYSWYETQQLGLGDDFLTIERLDVNDECHDDGSIQRARRMWIRGGWHPHRGKRRIRTK